MNNLSDWKNAGREVWGEMTNLPRAEAIIKACTVLEKDGENLSRERVRELIGGGSDRDIAPVIQLYQSRTALFDQFEHTPDTLLLLISKQVNQVFAELQQDYQDLQNAEKRLFVETSEAFSAEFNALETCNGVLSLTVAEKDLKIEGLIEELHQRDTRLETAQAQLVERDHRLKEKIIENDHLNSRLQEQKTQFTHLEDAHRQALTAAQGEFALQRALLIKTQDDETARLMTVQGNERAEWQKNERKLTKILDENAIVLKQHQSELAQRTDEVRLLTQDVQRAKHTLVELQNKITAQQDIHEKLEALDIRTQQLTQENQLLTQDNQRLEKKCAESSRITALLNTLQTHIDTLEKNAKKD